MRKRTFRGRSWVRRLQNKPYNRSGAEKTFVHESLQAHFDYFRAVRR